MARTTDQVWEQTVDRRRHRVETTGSVNHRVRWLVDDVEVATKSSMDDKLRLKADGVGRLTVLFAWSGTARRATVHGEARAGDETTDAKAIAGLGGTDLTPEPGSPAAAYEQRLRDHPTRYALIASLGGVGKVVVPIVATTAALLLWHLVRPLLPDLPSIPFPNLPDLPSIPTPDLPSIPLPNLPDLPDLPDVRLPGWLRWLLDHAHYVVPVVIAVVLARKEVVRRRTQDELRRSQDAEG